MMDCTPKMVMCVVTEFPGTVSNSTVQSQLFHVYQIICVEIETFMPIMLYVRAQRERLGNWSYSKLCSSRTWIVVEVWTTLRGQQRLWKVRVIYRCVMSNHISSVYKTLITDWFQCNKSITENGLKAKPSFIFSSIYFSSYNAVTSASVEEKKTSERKHSSTNLPKYIQKYHDWVNAPFVK